MNTINTTPWKAGVERHLANTPTAKFPGWNQCAGVKVLFHG